MNATDSPARIVGAVLTLVMIELTIATAYIHLSLGGTIFLLNGIGYLVLAAGVAATEPPIPIVQRLRWLPRVGLAAFALVTIGAYLVIGPYFLLGWITKAIEIAIIGLVVADLMNTYGIPGRLARAPMAPLARKGLKADERDALYAQIGAWWGEHAANGEIREGHELQGVETAKTVRRTARGKLMVTDGPYIDAKESIGGYAVIDVANLDAAIELASGWPVPGTLEIRPIVSEGN